MEHSHGTHLFDWLIAVLMSRWDASAPSMPRVLRRTTPPGGDAATPGTHRLQIDASIDARGAHAGLVGQVLTNGAPPPPLLAPFALAAPERESRGANLLLRADARPARGAPRHPGSALAWFPAQPPFQPGALFDFLTALARSGANGIIVQATASPRAVFRGVIAGWALRLAVAESAPDGSSLWHAAHVAATMRRGASPTWPPSW